MSTHDLRGYLHMPLVPTGDGIHSRIKLPFRSYQRGDFILLPEGSAGIRYQIVGGIEYVRGETSALVKFAPRATGEVARTPSHRVMSGEA
jgi:hypothetical protein